MRLSEIIQKSRKSFFFYAQNFLYIRSMKDEVVPFKFNYVQRRILWPIIKDCLKNKRPIRIIHAKARRMGASTFYEAFTFYRTALFPYTDAVILSHDLESGKYLFSICDLFYKMLPEYLKPEIRRGNVREILFDTSSPDRPGLRSRIYVETAQNAELGRSKQISIFHGSEVAFWPEGKARELMIGAEQSVPERPDTMIVYESTGNGASGEFYERFKRYYNQEDKNSVWKAIFIPWFLLEEYRMPLSPGETIIPEDREEAVLMGELGLSPEQIKWRRYTLLNKCDGDIDAFHREYPATFEEAFFYSVSNVFPKAILRELSAKTQKSVPVFIGDIYGSGLVPESKGPLKIWHHRQPYRDYAIGVDVAEGGEKGDNSVIEVIDILTLEQVAEWCGKVEPDILAQVVYLLASYYNYAKVAVEANNHGQSVILLLKEMGYRHLYKTKTGRGTTKDGWYTTKRTKPIMEDKFIELLREGEVIINSQDLVNEMSIYVHLPDGKTGASSGGNDDRVSAFMIALMCALSKSSILASKKKREMEYRKGLTAEDYKKLGEAHLKWIEYEQKRRRKKRIFPLAF